MDIAVIHLFNGIRILKLRQRDVGQFDKRMRRVESDDRRRASSLLLDVGEELVIVGNALAIGLRHAVDLLQVYHQTQRMKHVLTCHLSQSSFVCTFLGPPVPQTKERRASSTKSYLRHG